MNYNSWYKAKLLIAGFLLFICANQLFPQEVDEENDITREYFIEPGLEYYSPSHWNRQIKTININGLIGKECIEMIGLQVFAGATITHAWGNTIMVNELLKETQYKTSAMGIGPIILFRLQPINVGSFSCIG